MILLDTCAIIDMAAGKRLRESAVRELEVALAARQAFASTISAWEIGKLASLGRITMPLPPLTLYLNPNIPFGTSFEPPLPCDILMMTTG